MRFISTRHQASPLDFSRALHAGLAADGGLYVPEKFPDFLGSPPDSSSGFADFATKVLFPFVQGTIFEADLAGVCHRALNFPIPLAELDQKTSIIELFHGPSAAFKDVGARFLAEWVLMTPPSKSRKRTVLVATSGDTGGAVAGAFFGKPEVDVFVLFPKGKISARQEKQLTAWGGNVHAFSVQGDFDACQSIVKAAFQDIHWQKARSLISANSINIGRIIPQTLYYAFFSVLFQKKTGVAPGFIVPTGNLGNALAALWAKKMGFPIREVVFALNSNRAVLDYLETGAWKPAVTRSTLANAMHLGNPSNMERLFGLYPSFTELKENVSAFETSDEEIRKTIARKPWGRVWCPHTATAIAAHQKVAPGHWVLVATAHPAKFETIVEPLVGEKVEIPPELARLLNQPSHSVEIAPDLNSFSAAATKIS